MVWMGTDYGIDALDWGWKVDNNQMVAQKYKVMSIPTLLFFKNGEVVDRQVGLVPKSVIAAKMSAHA